MNERDVIEAFVQHLQPGLCVDAWPEDKNRTSPEIDAIAGSFAIEHTSIDTFPEQRGNSDWFMRAAGSLEQDISNKISFRLRITLEYEAIVKRQNWNAIRSALDTWITSEAPKLPDGHHKREIKGIPFRLHLSKTRDRPPGVYFGRFEPQPHDDTLASRIKELFERKAEKLAKYPDKVKVLLVENDDIALMNTPKMRDAIEKAFPADLPQGVDQLWYADTSIPSEVEFLKIR